MNYSDDENEIIQSSTSNTSKTKTKEHMEDLQQLGIKLVKLSNEQLSRLELEDTLLDAIRFAKTIKSNSALRRHYQYIGRLMRSQDELSIRQRLLLVLGESHEHTKLHHECENWRDKLLESDNALNLFISKYPDTDIVQLRQLIRSVRKELAIGKNKHYRELFQFIRQQVQI